MILQFYSAKMQTLDWNDLTYVIALHRAETLRGAAQRLGTSDTTVARRIAAVQKALGVTLFIRNDSGRHILTDIGAAVLAHAETCQQAVMSVQEIAGRLNAGLTGVVRISSVPILINRFLAPRIPQLHDAEPGLTLELVPDARALDLSKREADIAIRFARPSTGGLLAKTQKLGTLTFGVFAAAGLTEKPQRPLPWITYDDSHASLPQARWLRTLAQRDPAAPCPLRVADAETALEAAAHGVGRTLLPDGIASRDARLRRLTAETHPALPTRDVWMLSHADQERRAAVAAVKRWLTGLPWH